MQITRQADYAVRAILYLAEQGDNPEIYRRTIVQSLHDPALEAQKATCFIMK